MMELVFHNAHNMIKCSIPHLTVFFGMMTVVVNVAFVSSNLNTQTISQSLVISDDPLRNDILIAVAFVMYVMFSGLFVGTLYKEVKFPSVFVLSHLVSLCLMVMVLIWKVDEFEKQHTITAGVLFGFLALSDFMWVKQHELWYVNLSVIFWVALLIPFIMDTTLVVLEYVVFIGFPLVKVLKYILISQSPEQVSTYARVKGPSF